MSFYETLRTCSWTEASSALPYRSTAALNTADLSGPKQLRKVKSVSRCISHYTAFRVFLWALCNGASHKLLSSMHVFFSFRSTAVKGIFIQFSLRHSVKPYWELEFVTSNNMSIFTFAYMHKKCVSVLTTHLFPVQINLKWQFYFWNVMRSWMKQLIQLYAFLILWYVIVMQLHFVIQFY